MGDMKMSYWNYVKKNISTSLNEGLLRYFIIVFGMGLIGLLITYFVFDNILVGYIVGMIIGLIVFIIILDHEYYLWEKEFDKRHP